MKTAAKVFLIISTFAGGLIALVGFAIICARHDSSNITLTGFTYLGAGIVSLFFGLGALSKINNTTTRRALIPWGIAAFFFSSIVSGILILLITDEDLDHFEQQVKDHFASQIDEEEENEQDDVSPEGLSDI